MELEVICRVSAEANGGLEWGNVRTREFQVLGAKWTVAAFTETEKPGKKVFVFVF